MKELVVKMPSLGGYRCSSMVEHLPSMCEFDSQHQELKKKEKVTFGYF
jgi:hypothetical protein